MHERVRTTKKNRKSFMDTIMPTYAMATKGKRADMPIPGRQPASGPSDSAPPPLPARRAPPPIPQLGTKVNAAEESASDDEDSYEQPSAKLNQHDVSLQEIYDDFDELLDDFPPPPSTPPLPPPPPPSRPSRPLPIPQDSQELYDEFSIEDEGPPVSPYNPVTNQATVQQEIYDEFEEVKEEEVYEDPDESPAPAPTKSSSSSGLPPPLPPMDNRRKGSIPLPTPPVQKQRDLPPPPLDIDDDFEDEEQGIYEPAEEFESDEDAGSAPPPPPLPAGRLGTSNKPPPPARKTEEKKTPKGVNPIGMGIGASDIQGALKGLRKVSTGDNKTVEDKKNKDENNKNAKEALPFDEKKTFFAGKTKDGGLISGLKAKFTKTDKGTADKDKTVVTPSKDINGPPLPPRPESDTPEERELPPPPSPEEFPPPPSFDDDDQEIYDDASSQDLDPLAKFRWYHGVVERREGERLLRSIGKDGTFLIRKSTKGQDQPYTMAVLYQDRVNNLKVRLRGDKRIALGEAKHNEISFKDVEGMVEHHKKHPVLLIGTQKGEITLQGSPA